MIPSWNVLNAVAGRYGDHERDFLEDFRKFELARSGQLSIADLEENKERLALRLARNNSLRPFLIERINGVPNFQDAYILETLTELSKSVVRITRSGKALGSGFLVGSDVILTNHHVVGSEGEAQDLVAEFDYELDRQRVAKKYSSFRLNPAKFFLTSTLTENPQVEFSGLDFTLIGIDSIGINGEQLLQKYRPVYLDGNLGKIIKGESCVIIQHPGGEYKKVVLKDTAFFSETNSRLVYESDTLPGSSGSMVVALGTGSIIALHHAGLPRTNDQNRILTKTGALATASTPDEDIDWIGNEGIRVSCIISALKSARLDPSMEVRRQNLLSKTELIAERLDAAKDSAKKQLASVKQVVPAETREVDTNSSHMNTDPKKMMSDFLVTAVNKPEIIEQVTDVLNVRYNGTVAFALAMPGSAVYGAAELFYLRAPAVSDPNAEAQELCQVPGILNAEADIPLASNVIVGPSRGTSRGATESAIRGAVVDDGFGTPNEDDFLSEYARKHKSPYLKDQPASYEQNRKWHWAATGFDKALSSNPESPSTQGIRIVQFDTGFTEHPKVAGGFAIDKDWDFVAEDDNATDPRETGILRQPGHGTRTGSLLIGLEQTAIKDNGNAGFLSFFNYQIVPFRIASSVILIDRQRELAHALDMAITQGFDIITMSMGLPPTIATAKMAKKAYDAGVIWCCAAGNEVQAVVAPAVYPGTIGIAASNPLDRDWSGSSRGDGVDITAPGQAVYVPILVKGDQKYGFAYGDGTSYATPHIAAAAALWLAKYKAELNKPEYAGWKRVEAFRKALKKSARRKNALPRYGFGSGMLDADALMKLGPTPPKDSDYAYNNWNEHAFFAMLQGAGEIAKTYWNRIHGALLGTRRGGQESIESMPLSPIASQIERALFRDSVSATEAVSSQTDLIARYALLQNKIVSASKK